MGTHAEIAKRFGDVACFADLADEILAVGGAAHGRPAASGRPNRRDDRANDKTPGADLVCQTLNAVIVNLDTEVRIEQENIDAIKPNPVDFRASGQIEHRVQVDGRFGARAAFADQAGPHGIVELGKGIGVLCAHIVLESDEASAVVRLAAIGKWRRDVKSVSLLSTSAPRRLRLVHGSLSSKGMNCYGFNTVGS